MKACFPIFYARLAPTRLLGFLRAQRLGSPSALLILGALEATGWVVGGPYGAAARLGMKRTTLIARMKKHGIFRPPEESTLDQAVT